MFDWLPTSLQNPFFISEVEIPLVLIFLDVISGIVAALKHGNFQGKSLANFWSNDVFKYLIMIVMVYLVYTVSGNAVATMVASTLGLGTLGTSTATSMYQNLREFLTPAELAFADQVGASLGYPDQVVPPPIVQAAIPPVPAISNPVVASGTGVNTLLNTGISPVVQAPAAPPTFTQ
jgi:hypothetical protein